MIKRSEALKVVYDLLAIVKTSLDDLFICRKKINKNQFWRRTFVRSLFASIEGINHSIKKVSLLLINILKIKLTNAEIAMLKEETYILNEKGDVTLLKTKLRAKENLCFTLKTFARACKTSYEIDRNSGEWSSYNEALRIRDRLTHPSKSDDLIISDAELEIVQKAHKWYFTCVRNLLKIAVSSLESLLIDDTKKKAKKK